MKKHLIKNIYAITPDINDTDLLLNSVEFILESGVKILQYRNKSNNFDLKLDQSVRLQKLCKKYECLFIINDDIDLACRLNADGLHLGKDDFNLEFGDLNQIRHQFGTDKIIGISCYNSIKIAEKAKFQNADYVAFGSMFPSKTKPNAKIANFETLTLSKQSIDLPIVAIGGINFENVDQIIEAGANSVALIGVLFDDLVANNPINIMDFKQKISKLMLKF